jgi:hypothetical protein
MNLLPLNSSFDSAYPAKVEMITEATMTRTVTTIELNKYLLIGIPEEPVTENSRTKFCKVNLRTKNLGG